MEVDEEENEEGEEIIIKSEPFDHLTITDNNHFNFSYKYCFLCKSNLKSKNGLSNLSLPATCFSCGGSGGGGDNEPPKTKRRNLRSKTNLNSNNNNNNNNTSTTIAINKFDLASVIWNEFNLPPMPPISNNIFPFCTQCSTRLGEFYLVLQQLQGLEEKLTNLRHELMQEFEQQQQQRDINEDEDPLSTFNDDDNDADNIEIYEDIAVDPDNHNKDNHKDKEEDEAMIRNNETKSSSSSEDSDDDEGTPTPDQIDIDPIPLESKVKRSTVIAKPSLNAKLKPPKTSSKIIKKNTNKSTSSSSSQLVYTCTICARTFNNRLNYNRHMSIHNPTTAAASTSLTRNGKKKKKRHAQCPTCHQIFPSRKQQLIHSILIHGDKSIGRIVRKTSDSDASASGSAPPKELTRADLIDKAIGEELNIAAIASNTNINVLHDCAHCGRTFDRYQPYQSHLELHTPIVVKRDGAEKPRRRKPASCTECGQTFCSRQLALKHAKDVHGVALEEVESRSKKGKGVKPVCEICGQVYCDNTQLKKHLQSIHQKLEIYPCLSCPLKFCTKQSLYWHTVNEHDAVKKYSCDHCSERFNTGIVKRKHMATVHPNQLQYIEWVCRVCWRAEYESADALAAHQELAHGDFKCHICGKYEITRYKLKSHMLVHTKEKSHSCPLCGNLFTRKENVRAHMRKVHSVNLVEYDNGPVVFA